MDKQVIVYTGGPGSGKTYQCMMYASTRGIEFNSIRWTDLRLYIKSGVVFKIQQRICNNHLFC